MEEKELKEKENKKKDLKAFVKDFVDKRLEELDNDKLKEELKEKDITSKRISELFNFVEFIDFHYLAKHWLEIEDLDKDEDIEIDEANEYFNELKGDGKSNYEYLSQAYECLTNAERYILNSYFRLSYLADIYDDIEDVEDALSIINLNIKDKLKSEQPYFSYSKEQIKSLLTSEGFNPNKSSLLRNDTELEKIRDDINNEIIDHTKPYTYEDVNNSIKESEGLEYKYLLFCETYLNTGKVTETCKKLGIGRNTAYRWLDLEEVKDYIAKRKQEVIDENRERYNSLYDKCIDVLESSLNGYETKLKAVDIFLKHYDNVTRVANISKED